MLIIPIAQVDNVVRRHPWVSYTLLMANILFSTVLMVVYHRPTLIETAEKRVAEVMREVEGKPYLSVPPTLQPWLDADTLRELAQRRRGWRGVALDAGQVAREQAHVNELADEALENLEQLPSRRFGYVPATPSFWRMWSAMFVHGGWLHLVGNMLFLYLVGPFVEDRFGRVLFTALYLLSGAAAASAHTFAQPGSQIPMVGASGAIAGLMGAFLIRLAWAKIRFLMLPIPIIPALRIYFTLPAVLVLPLWLGEQVLAVRQTGLQGGSQAGVAYAAHIGGFVFGALFAIAVRLMRVEETWINPAIEKATTTVRHPALEAAIDARAQGELVVAQRQLQRLLADEPDNVDGWAEALELALAEGRPDAVGDALTRLIDIYQKMGETILATRLLHDQRWGGVGTLPVRAYMTLAAFASKVGDGRKALDLYEAAVASAPAELSALRALLKRGEIFASAGDARRAHEELARARGHVACRGPWLELVDKAQAALPPLPRIGADSDDAVIERGQPERGGPKPPGPPPLPRP
jgi:membrane associated rhomboid family serine protease